MEQQSNIFEKIDFHVVVKSCTCAQSCSKSRKVPIFLAKNEVFSVEIFVLLNQYK